MPADLSLRRLALAGAALVVTLVARAGPAIAKDEAAPMRATSADPAVAAAAIAELRARGSEGLAQLLAAREPELASLEISGDAGRRLVAAIDAVAAQRDARFSRLYWHMMRKYCGMPEIPPTGADFSSGTTFGYATGVTPPLITRIGAHFTF